MIHCSCLIAGGTMEGCGFAAARPGSLLAEENFVPGWDFILTLAPVHVWASVTHPDVIRFREEFSARKGIDEEGYLRHGALYPEFSAWLLEKKVSLRLGCTVIPGEREGIFRLISSAGTEEVVCEEFRDFRPVRKESVLFHVLIGFPAGRRVTGAFGSFVLDPSPVPDCAVLTLTLRGEITMDQARTELRKVWSERPEELKEGRIAWSAEALDPALYSDPFSALEAGLRKGGAR